MNKQLGRLLLAGVCCLAAVSAASAQPWPSPGDNGDDAAHPSHRLLTGGVGDLAGAEDQLARRLHHTQDVQEIQDLVKNLNNSDFRTMLKDVKNLSDDDIKGLKETIRNNPQLLDDPKLHDMLKDMEKFKQGGADLHDLPQETKDGLAQLAKDIIAKQKAPDPAPGNPMTGDPRGLTPPAAPKSVDLPPPLPPPDRLSPPSPQTSKPDWITHNLTQGMAGLIKDIDRTPEGEALRTAALRELAKLESTSSSSSSGLADFLKSILSSDQAAWLAHAGKTTGAGFSSWDAGPVASSAPAFGASSDGLLDGVVWIAALALLVAAAWMAVAMARRQAAARRGARPWSPGPWPVRPSQVSTRRDLIRAFEHLAYLLLGQPARSLNHLDVADRLGGDDDGRARAADRLAHLYEQARYAPPDEVMPLHELTAARGDLVALAGAAA